MALGEAADHAPEGLVAEDAALVDLGGRDALEDPFRDQVHEGLGEAEAVVLVAEERPGEGQAKPEREAVRDVLLVGLDDALDDRGERRGGEPDGRGLVVRVREEVGGLCEHAPT